MKHLICGIIMAISLFLAAGFIGGLECDSIPVSKAVTGAIISLLIFAISGKVGKIIE